MKRETRSFYERVVQRTVERIAGSLDEALELDALAMSSGLSPFHFHRVFRGMVGETAVEMGSLHRRMAPASGEELGPGVSYEMYLNTPAEVP